MNLKPFNLEEALAGKPVVTRGGRPVTEIYHFKTAIIDFPVSCVVDGEVIHCTTDGFFYDSSNPMSSDLFMAPETMNVWINVWRDKGNQHVTSIYTNETSACVETMPNIFTFIKTVPVTIEL